MSANWKTTVVPLAYPIPGEGDTPGPAIAEIAMREPDADALERIEAAGVMSIEEGKSLSLRQVRICVSALSGIDEKTLGKLHYKDLTKLGGAIGPLLSGSEAEDTPSVH